MPSPRARIGDLSLGHWLGDFYFPPTPLVSGDVTELTGYMPSSRTTDIAMPHFGWLYGMIPVPVTSHLPVALTGSVTDFDTCPLQAFRVGDFYACGDIQAEGWVTDLVG